MNIGRESCRRNDPIIFQNNFNASQRKIVTIRSKGIWSLQQERAIENEAISRIKNLEEEKKKMQNCESLESM